MTITKTRPRPLKRPLRLKRPARQPGTLTAAASRTEPRVRALMAAAPRAETPTIELETAFADASLEMDETGLKFRVSLALQDAIADAGGGDSWSVAANIKPKHWWRSDNVVSSGGLVDTIVDNGAGGKPFVASGTARTTLTSDGLGAGKSYLDFTPSQFYTAGIAADWPWLHNGNPFTIGIVFRRRNFNAFDRETALLATMAWDYASVGVRVALNADEIGPPTHMIYGPSCVVHGEAGTVQMQTHFATSTQDSAICSLILRRFRPASSQIDWWNPTGNTRSYVYSGDMFLRGARVAYSGGQAKVEAFTPGTAAGPLTLNRFVGGGGTNGNAAIYEALCTDKAISDYDAAQLANYWSQSYLIG